MTNKYLEKVAFIGAVSGALGAGARKTKEKSTVGLGTQLAAGAVAGHVAYKGANKITKAVVGHGMENLKKIPRHMRTPAHGAVLAGAALAGGVLSGTAAYQAGKIGGALAEKAKKKLVNKHDK